VQQPVLEATARFSLSRCVKAHDDAEAFWIA